MRFYFGFLASLFLGIVAIYSARVGAADVTLSKALVNEITPDASATPPAAGQWLRAGPIHVKLEDGQLRYFYVGDKEIIRRIYFGVRDAKWNTALPTFTKITVDKADDHFTVNLAADCKMDAVDFSWTGVITGSPDGKITFQTTGTPNADFQSNRIGLCVLFGVHSLAGQEFETDGLVAKGEFPKLISPKLVAAKFHKLQYLTAGGVAVSCSLDGAIFDMEDQRNWGDSSWKAYAPLPYAYKQVGKGDAKTETVTIAVSGATDAQPAPLEPVHVTIGQPLPGARVPALVALPVGAVEGFTEISFNHDKYKDAKQVAWSYIPTTHLPDDDVIMENMPTVAYQAKTVKSINPDCAMHVGPIGLSEAGVKDPRADKPIAAAWAAGMVKYLSMGGVDEAAFSLGNGAPAAVLDAIKPYAQQQFLNVATDPPHSHHVVPFAAENDRGVGLFLMNPTARPSQAEVNGLTAKQVQVLRVTAGAVEQSADVADGTLKLDLAPYEVVRVTIAK